MKSSQTTSIPKPSMLKRYLPAICGTALLLTTFCLLLTSHANSSLSASLLIPRYAFKQRCPYPIVYNKPPKTASSFITTVMRDWANATSRPSYKCSMTPIMTSVLLPDCLPKTPDSCAVVHNHIFLSPSTTAFLRQRLPGYRVITSTRYPPHRIVSFYLQIHGLTADKPEDILPGLNTYLERLNPWAFYNYHTGERRTGSCPLSKEDMVDIFDISTRYDMVIDATLRTESNIILKHEGLFQLPEVPAVSDREKERGAWRWKLPPDTVELLKRKTCVEVELHKMFQIRMARMYEVATGKPCLRHGGDTRASISSCIEDRERELLKDNWIG